MYQRGCGQCHCKRGICCGGISTAVTVAVHLLLVRACFFTDGYDNANHIDSQVAIDAAAASTVQVVGVGLSSESYRAEELAALSEESVSFAQDSSELSSQFVSLAQQIDLQRQRVYALVYCTPSGAGSMLFKVRLADSQDQQPAEFSFIADGLTGCQSADDVVNLCDAKECGGLGCGACDDSGGIECDIIGV